MAGASAILFSGVGVTGEIVKPQKGTSAPNTAKITVAKDAPLGAREFRIITPRGATSVGYFVVGDLPEIIEEEPNDSFAEARKPIPSDDPKAKPKERFVQVPSVVNGRLDSKEDVDTFVFHAKVGQTILFEGQGVTIGSLSSAGQFLDTRLALFDGAGKKLAENDDFRSKDSMLVYAFPRAGEYGVQVSDTNYKNNGAFAYRVTISQRPLVTGVFPLTVSRGKTAKLELAGLNLGKDAIVKVAIPTDAPLGRRDVQVTPHQSWQILVGDLPELAEKEPNNSTKEAQKISAPVTVNGRLAVPGDADSFALHGKKGERIIVEIQAARLGSPLDSVLVLTDAKDDKKLMESEDTMGRDSRLDYTFDSDRNVVLTLRDLARRGNPDYSYSLAVAPLRPDFALTVEPDNIVVPRGGRVLATVRASRMDGFADPIHLHLSKLPGGTSTVPTDKDWVSYGGMIQVPPGSSVVNVDNPILQPVFSAIQGSIAANRTEAFILLASAPDAPLDSVPLTIEGSTKIGKETIMRRAVPVEGRNIGGARATHEVTLMTVGVGEKADIVIYAPAESAPAMMAAGAPLPPPPPAPSPLVLKPNGKLNLKVKAVRNGYKGEITLRAVNLPAGVTSSEMKINGDVQDATITLTSANTGETTATIFVAGIIAKPPVLSMTHASVPLTLQVKK